MTAEHVQGDEPLIAMPALTLDALREAVAAVLPSRLPEFFQEIQDAFSQAGDEDSVYCSSTGSHNKATAEEVPSSSMYLK